MSREASYSRQLTDREKQVLEMIWDGMPQRSIGSTLCLSYRTVGNHVAHIFDKFGVNSIVEAIRKGLEFGILESPSVHKHRLIHYCVDCFHQVDGTVLRNHDEGGDAKPE